ncbi:hypothetical protein BS17DRAFT_818147 [Gyrodon lividus]|nr:hypothetical protein BS17DRAFT_818147 [Gyrodon lividus]
MDFLGLIVDEAHRACKFNKFHQALHGLQLKSTTMVAMTATPVMTQLQDLWTMGSVLGLPAYANKNKFDDMNKELNRARAKDCRAERESETSGDQLHSLLEGEENANEAGTLELAPKLQEWIPWLRGIFAKHVIRHTLDSVDSRRQKIFGLPPYVEHTLLLELLDWEKECLGDITDELVDSTSMSTISGAGKNFYIELRRTLLHPHMNPRGGNDAWVTPESLDHWKQSMWSTKLDMLTKIVTYHLKKDAALPLKVLKDGITIAPVDTQGTYPYSGKESDHIVIFSAFPSSNAAIIDRKTILNEFRALTRDAGACVLILSSVGTVGLNLACANIMVIASALDDKQLRGRIYWYPQPKHWNLHKPFLGLDDRSRSLFSGPEGGDNNDDNDNDNAERDNDANDASEPPVTPSWPMTKCANPLSPPSADRAPRGQKKTKPAPLQKVPAPPQMGTHPTSAPTPAPVPNAAPHPAPTPAPTPVPVPPSAGSTPSGSRTTQPFPFDLFGSSSAPSAGSADVEMEDVTCNPPWDPTKDKILNELRDDPDWEKDPEELKAMANLGLAGNSLMPDSAAPSSPLSSPPHSPIDRPTPARGVLQGVKSRTRNIMPSSSAAEAGPSS